MSLQITLPSTIEPKPYVLPEFSMQSVLAALPPVKGVRPPVEKCQTVLVRTPPPAPIKGKGVRFDYTTRTWQHTDLWWIKADFEEWD